MWAEVLYHDDIDPTPLQNRSVAVLGYGSQGHAHALNLRDSGIDVAVGLPVGSSSVTKAEDQGLLVMDPISACREADVVIMLVPDPAQPLLFEQAVLPNLAEGDALLFSHGYNIHFGTIEPPSHVDVGLIAPKAPGHEVRNAFSNGGGVPCLTGVSQDATGNAWKVVRAYARAIGAGKSGVLTTTFGIETETDLFGEQVPLCGGLWQLVKTAFEVLVEAGYPPEAAYFECSHELKLIVDLVFKHGWSGMFHSISTTAKYGALTVGPTLFGEDFKEHLRGVLANITSGTFAGRWGYENQIGQPNLRQLLAEVASHPIEEVGADLRALMPMLRAEQGALTAVAGGAVG